MERRSFLTALGTVALSARSAASTVAQALQSQRRIERIGLQLFTLRALMKGDVAGTLEQVAQIGFREVEFAGYFGVGPSEVRRMLRNSGLQAPSTHVSLSDLAERLQVTLDTAAEIGHNFVVLSILQPDERPTVDAYRRVAQQLNRAGLAAKRAGLRIGYHNHAFEFAPVGGVLPYEVLLSETQRDLVCMELDLYWIARGGRTASSYFRSNAGRFELCHVKDMDASGEIADVGAGRLDFAAIFSEGRTAGLRHFFVEHDNAKDPLASVKASFGYLNRLRFSAPA